MRKPGCFQFHPGIAVTVLVAGWVLLAAAQDNGPRAPLAAEPTLDRQLLDDLDRAPRPAQATDKAAPPSRRKLEREPIGSPATLAPQRNDGSSHSGGNRAVAISEQMKEASRRLAAGDTSLATQAVQERIMRDLAALLKSTRDQQPPSADQQASSEKESQAGASGGQPMLTSPGDSGRRAETGAARAGGPVNLKDAAERAWGHLPDRIRQQMQASLSEQFLPKYERLIEDYYRRLAEEPPARP